MTSSSQTSRSSLVDELELVANLIATVSHLNELKHGYIADEDVDNVRFVDERIRGVTQMRRDIMTKMKERFASEESDYQYWCLAKHAIAQWQYAMEVNAANEDVIYEKIENELYTFMFEIISKWLGYEPVQCGRCLNDMIEDG